jgi:hypothetical protein
MPIMPRLAACPRPRPRQHAISNAKSRIDIIDRRHYALRITALPLSLPLPLPLGATS